MNFIWLLALALVVILKPMYNWFLERKWIRGSERKATGMTLVVFILLIAIPVILIVGGSISQAAFLFSNLTVEGWSSRCAASIRGWKA